MTKTPYDSDFYFNQRVGSTSSAHGVVPLIIDLFNPRSVVDVGCGTGTWLSVFQKTGVDDVFGVDGAYVDTASLMIDRSNFQPADLTRPLKLSRKFDLACCLEVGEHIPTHLSGQLVNDLINLAPVIIFSAAVPGQCGVDHINEQWQFYWSKLFSDNGYLAVDCIRPAIFDNHSIDWWYRQNILAYCKPGFVPSGCSVVDSAYHINRILPEMTIGPKNGTQALEFLKISVPILTKGIQNKLHHLIARR